MRIVPVVIFAALLLGACGSEEEEVPATTDVQPTEPKPEGQGASAESSATSTDPTGQPGPAVPVADPKAAETACTALATNHCARLHTCAPGLYPMLRVDDASCISIAAKRCLLDVRAIGSRLDVAGTLACATAIGTAACEDVVADRLPSVCHPAGSLAAGIPCGAALQCQSGFCPGGAAAAGCGVCAPTVKAGGACLAGKCPSGLSCKANVCVVSKKLGDACTATTQCGVGQICSANVCATGRPLGGLCALDADCNWLDGLYCSFATNRCAKVSIAAVGDSCGLPGFGGLMQACSAAGECGADVCIARPKETEACSAAGPKCHSGLACVAGACTAFDPSSCK